MSTFAFYTVPVVNVPQTFVISLAGVSYNMTCKWNSSPDGGWVLDLADSNNNLIACNIPLITGADCLKGLEYLGIDGKLYVYTSTNLDAVPTLNNLGIDSLLLFYTDVAGG